MQADSYTDHPGRTICHGTGTIFVTHRTVEGKRPVPLLLLRIKDEQIALSFAEAKELHKAIQDHTWQMRKILLDSFGVDQ